VWWTNNERPLVRVGPGNRGSPAIPVPAFAGNAGTGSPPAVAVRRAGRSAGES
jgi:hypothetical protein